MHLQQTKEDIPAPVLNHLRYHVCRLQEAAQRCNSVMAARGRGHILALEVRDLFHSVEANKKAVLEISRLASEKELTRDLDLYIASLGGVPDFSVFGEPAAL